MGERWLICLPVDQSGRVAWINPGDGGRMVRHDLLSSVAVMAKKRVVVVVPAADVLLTWVVAPRAAKRDLIKAIPFLLEDALSVPVETLHFAVGGRQPDGLMPVAVVSRSLMEGWLGELRVAGVTPEVLLPESLLIPWESTVWTVLIVAGVAIVRSGAFVGFSVDLENLVMALQLALADSRNTRPTRLRVLDYSDGTSVPPDLSAVGLAVQLERVEGSQPLSLMATHDRVGGGINLLQGVFAPVGRWSGVVKAVRLPLILLFIWILVKVGLGLESAWRMEQRIAWLDQRIETIFKESFPQVRRIVNPRVQMNQQLEALREQGGSGAESRGFLMTLAQVGSAFKAMPDLILQGVRYQEHKLELLLRLPDLQQLDGLKQRLEGDGLQVVIQSAVREGAEIVARLKVERP